MVYFTEPQLLVKMADTELPTGIVYATIQPMADAWALMKAPSGSTTLLSELAMAYAMEYVLAAQKADYVPNLNSDTIKTLLSSQIRWCVEI